uniref:Uncharacterized protein n=1 Tax=Romanomermis culicivorax TaxID=13658 RepID=A0A915I3F8_ROMCU
MVNACQRAMKTKAHKYLIKRYKKLIEYTIGGTTDSTVVEFKHLNQKRFTWCGKKIQQIKNLKKQLKETKLDIPKGQEK